MGTNKLQGQLDVERVIPEIQALLRLGVKYGFTSLTASVEAILAQHAIGTPLALSCILKKMKGFNGFGDDWRFHFKELLDLANAHKIYSMLPGIYCLFLALDGPAGLSKNRQLSMSDRLRCSTGFYPLHRDICRLGAGRVRQQSANWLDHHALRDFSCLTGDEQENVWESLPEMFQLPRWEELWKSPNLNITIT